MPVGIRRWCEMPSRLSLPAVYLVGWDQQLILKAGFASQKRRWRRFELRGAKIYGLGWSRAALDVELAVHSFLRFGMPEAFETCEAAAPYLGVGGGGYLECFRAPDYPTYRFAIEQCLDIMHAGIATEHYWPSCHERTDGRTYVEPRIRPHRSDRLNARESETRFR